MQETTQTTTFVVAGSGPSCFGRTRRRGQNNGRNFAAETDKRSVEEAVNAQLKTVGSELSSTSPTTPLDITATPIQIPSNDALPDVDKLVSDVENLMKEKERYKSELSVNGESLRRLTQENEEKELTIEILSKKVNELKEKLDASMAKAPSTIMASSLNCKSDN